MNARLRSPRTRTLLVAATVAVGLLAGACGGRPSGGRPVMGQPRVTASDMAGWFHSKGSGGFASVSVEQLAQHFLDEGAAEGVAGDLAFVQAMVETGWLRFSPRMPRWHNNFSGLGAVDGGSSSAAFPSARIGVRAQIQHLRAYADAGVHPGNLAHPLVDPRFHYVAKGSAWDWTQFGRGVWASDRSYSSRIIGLHDELIHWAATH